LRLVGKASNQDKELSLHNISTKTSCPNTNWMTLVNFFTEVRMPQDTKVYKNMMSTNKVIQSMIWVGKRITRVP